MQEFITNLFMSPSFGSMISFETKQYYPSIVEICLFVCNTKTSLESPLEMAISQFPATN